MRNNIPSTFPLISVDVLQSMLKKLPVNDVSCYMRQQESKLRIMIDFPSANSERIINSMYDCYFSSKKNGSIPIFILINPLIFSSEITNTLKRAIITSRNILEKEIENRPDLDDVEDGEKKELFEKNRVFAEFLRQSPKKHYQEVIDLIFNVIGCQKIDREININEFCLIQKLSEIEESDFPDDILFLHDPQKQKLIMFFLLDKQEEANLLKKKLETHFYFDLSLQMKIPQESQLFPIFKEKKDLIAKRINDVLVEKQRKCRVHSIKHDLTTFELKKFDEKSLRKFKNMLMDEFSDQNTYFFNLIIDLPSDNLSDFTGELEKKIQKENLNITISSDKFEHYNSFLEMIPKNEFMSIKFLGKGSDLYKYFKSKPKCLFQTSGCYIFCERLPEIIRIVEKMMFKKVMDEVDIEFSNSLFIDLSHLPKDQRLLFDATSIKKLKF